MPFEIVCGVCGETLYLGMELRSAKEVVRATSFKCRVCGTLLSTKDSKIEVFKSSQRLRLGVEALNV